MFKVHGSALSFYNFFYFNTHLYNKNKNIQSDKQSSIYANVYNIHTNVRVVSTTIWILGYSPGIKWSFSLVYEGTKYAVKFILVFSDQITTHDKNTHKYNKYTHNQQQQLANICRSKK